MQGFMKFLKQNGLSIFSLIAIVGIVAWVASRPPLPDSPVVPEPTFIDGTPLIPMSPEPVPGDLVNQLVSVAGGLGLNTETFSTCLSSRKYQALVNASINEGRDMGVNGTPASIINGSLVVGFVPLSDIDQAIVADQGSLRPDTAGFAFLGDKNAPNTIVEYGDYLCGYCRKYHDELLPQIQEKYIKTGKVKFVFKDMVIFNRDIDGKVSDSSPSQLIAEAARCAGDQGKFWEYHGLGFSLNLSE